MASISGNFPRWHITGLENWVSQARLDGHNISIWIGKGLIRKPFRVTGDREIINRLANKLSSMNNFDEK